MSPYKVELECIRKSFGGIRALKDVSLRAKAGSIHAIVGENGAGKSTLMKILAGAYRKDGGIIRIDGREVRIGNPREGGEHGVGIIYQEFSLVPDLSVAENIFLHYLNRRNVWMPWSEIRTMAEEKIRNLGFDIPVNERVRNLSTAQQQVVEIAKALSGDADILILDEPTAVLVPHETLKLFAVLRMLRDKGVTIFYISHRLEEIFSIADYITILKDGEVTRSAEVSDLDPGQVISAMIGRKLEALFPAREYVPGPSILKIENLRSFPKVKGVSFRLRKGEVLGIAGLVGSGRTETLRAIFSADRRDGGEVFLDGERLRLASPRDAVRAGIALVPEDRKTQGVLLSLSLKENMSITDLDSLSGISGFIRAGAERKKSLALVDRLRIRSASLEAGVEQLSGGNQQKVVLAKWLGRSCRIILMDEPTRGIDVGAKTEIYALINDLAAKGVGIVMVSSEMLELMGVCDRILVMHEGRINGDLERKDFSEENIMRLSVEKNESYAP